MFVASSHASQKVVVNGRVVNDSSRLNHMEAQRGIEGRWVGHTRHQKSDLENIGLAGKRDRYTLDVDQGIDTFRDIMNPGDYHRYRHKTLKESGTPRQLREKIKGLSLPEAPKKYRIDRGNGVRGKKKIREGIKEGMIRLKTNSRVKAPLQSKSTRSRRRVAKGKGVKRKSKTLKKGRGKI